jgi:hypothetical protein
VKVNGGRPPAGEMSTVEAWRGEGGGGALWGAGGASPQGGSGQAAAQGGGHRPSPARPPPRQPAGAKRAAPRRL